jgi:hypothetical protein
VCFIHDLCKVSFWKFPSTEIKDVLTTLLTEGVPAKHGKKNELQKRQSSRLSTKSGREGVHHDQSLAS